MKLLQLTEEDGTKFYLNPEHIDLLRPSTFQNLKKVDQPGTRILLVNQSVALRVQEDINTIVKELLSET
jgi:hypothetical protein